MAVLEHAKEPVTPIGSARLALGFLTLYLVYCIIIVNRRLFFHPLSKVPGPRLAAATKWYETYYELVSGGGGMYTMRIKDMHAKYGPIIRINPTEVHIDDPEYYETIYTPSQPYDKLIAFENRFNMPRAAFSTAPAGLHKLRRSAVAPFFATSRVRGHGPFIQTLADEITHRLQTEYAGRGKPLVFNDVFGCLTGDVITNLAFARSWNFIQSPKWESPFTVAIGNLVNSTHWTTHFPWIIPLMNCIPDRVIIALSGLFKPIIEFRREMEVQISDILGGKNQDVIEASHKTVFLSILEAKLPPEETSVVRLQNEAMSVIGAGFETTRWALTVAMYHILANASVRKRLRQELFDAIPDPAKIPAWAELQQLEYLSAVIEEALRLSYGVVQRSPRVSWHSTFQYEQYVLPPGTPVSSDAYHMHHNERVFPDSFTFKPERWLGNPKGPDGVKQLSRYHVAFGRGARMCLGMPVAYCEIYITLATLFRRFDFELYQTDRRSVDFHHDMLTPQPAYDQEGVKVLVR